MQEVIPANDDGAVVENELTGVGLDDDRLARTAFCTVGSRENVDRSVVGKRQNRGIGSREGLFDGLVELGVLGRVVLFHVVVDVLAERSLGLRQQDSVLRALRAGDRGNNGSQIQLDVLREDGFLVGVVPQALFLGVRLDESELLVAAAGEAQVFDGLGVDREDRCGGTEFGAHVAQRRAVRERNLGNTVAVELDELADDAVLTEHLGGGEHDVGCGDAGLDLTGELEADDAGISMETGWPSIAASASMPPTPQPSTPRPLTIVVCESVPTQVSGYACPLRDMTVGARYSMLTW